MSRRCEIGRVGLSRQARAQIVGSAAATGPFLLGSALPLFAQTPPATPAAAPPAAPPATVPGPTSATSALPLNLSAAVTAAGMANPASRVAQQQLVQAQARFAQVQAQQRFQATFASTLGGSNAKVIQPPPVHESFTTLTNTVTVPLPLGRKPRLAVEQATQVLNAAQAQFDSARIALITQVSTAYYDVLRKQALLQAAQDNLKLSQQQLSAAERRFRAGDVPELDVLRAQVPVASAEAALYQAQTNVTVAQQALNGLLVRPLDSQVSVADVPVPATALPLTLEEARDKALRFSPDVRATDATLRAQELGRNAARLFREPTYSVQGSDTRSNDQTSFSRLDSIQATITIPLSDGGLGRAQVREADAALQQARVQAEGARQTTLVTVSNAYLTALSSLKQIEAARVARDISVQTYDKTQIGYQNGLFPLTDVLNAQSARAQAQVAYTQAVYDASAALTTLNNVTGTPLQESPPQESGKP